METLRCQSLIRRLSRYASNIARELLGSGIYMQTQSFDKVKPLPIPGSLAPPREGIDPSSPGYKVPGAVFLPLLR